MKRILGALILTSTLHSTPAISSPLPETEVINEVDPVEASLRVMSYSTARLFWDRRTPSTFLSRREMANISIAAVREANRLGIPDAQEIGLLVHRILFTYQQDHFDSWRGAVGDLVLILPPRFQGSVAQAFLDFIASIDLGDVAAIIAQVVAIIQLFV